MKITMKRIFAILAVMAAFMSAAKADDRPVTYQQLPASAQAFIPENYPADKVSYATKDDDLILPDYTVVLVSGVKISFNNDGSLEKIESKVDGVPAGLIPVQIREYVRHNYHDVAYVEYEIGRRTYEVKLSNGMELTFNSKFALIGIDD